MRCCRDQGGPSASSTKGQSARLEPGLHDCLGAQAGRGNLLRTRIACKRTSAPCRKRRSATEGPGRALEVRERARDVVLDAFTAGTRPQTLPKGTGTYRHQCVAHRPFRRVIYEGVDEQKRPNAPPGGCRRRFSSSATSQSKYSSPPSSTGLVEGGTHWAPVLLMQPMTPMRTRTQARTTRPQK